MLRYPVSLKGVFKVSKITIFLSKMPYWESEPDFSNFVINSLSTFVPIFSESKSESESDDSESDFGSVFINLDICIFLPYIYTLLNKLADDCFYLFSRQIQ